MIHRFGLPLLAAVVATCAQASPPPGGIPDRSPPRIIETFPAQNAIVPDFRGEVRIRFDETLGERGPGEGEMAFVSPETGEVKVKRAGKELKVSIEGGWQPGRVYHVVVLPGFVDRRGNARRDAYELVFSTGPEILPTILGGMIEDRLTGRPVGNVRVVALSLADSTAYVTQSDSAGFFALRSLPLGDFRLEAYIDQNRNRIPDGLEARADTLARLVATNDTPIVELSILARDTTPARLLRAELRDSMQVTLTFDDFIRPDEPLTGVTVSMWMLPDSTRHPFAGQLMRLREAEARERAEQPPDTTAAPLPVERGPPVDTTRILPSQVLVWRGPAPFPPGTRYRVTVTGIRNIGGVPDGGGSTTFETPRPRARPVAPRDTAAAQRAPADTTSAPPAVPDTISR